MGFGRIFAKFFKVDVIAVKYKLFSSNGSGIYFLLLIIKTQVSEVLNFKG